MRKILVAAILLISVFSVACDSATQTPTAVIKVTMTNTEHYFYATGITDDGDDATISRQAEHYIQSEITRDESTNFEAVYKYRPEVGYVGEDLVKIELSRASGDPKLEIIRIEFNVSN